MQADGAASPADARRTLSVVVPFFNEGANVAALLARLVPALDALSLDWDIVAVNDGSADDTLERLLAARAREPRLKIIDLSRNFGKERCLSAGLAHAQGQAVVMIDADLQHPPETIQALVARWRAGDEVVYAVRESRTDQSWIARILARAFYAVFDRLSEVPVPRGAGDFRLLDRQVVDVINRMPERTRFMKGIYSWVGFRQSGVSYREEARHQGETKWPVIGLMRLAIDGLTAFSNFPLRVWTLVGAAISSLAFLYIVYRLLRVVIYGIDVPGYESIIMIVLFLGGVQLLTLGIIGDYIGRIFAEVKGRPLYIVRRAYGADEPSDSTD
ncbi:MAG: glycosyltransferase family 2 protein [Alphaproteobacteria bacterium]